MINSKIKNQNHIKFLIRELQSSFLFFFITFLFCLTFLSGQAQSGAERCKWIQLSGSPFQLDTLTLVPQSLKIQHPDSLLMKVAYNPNTNQIDIQSDAKIDSVLVCYQVFPFNFAKKSFHRDIAGYDSTDTYTSEFFRKQNRFDEKREELFDLKGISKSGNLTRGIAFGAAQDFTSSLNLQLEGKLSEDISILAAISDQNVPFQPEGNTQQIQDFDRVFIRFSHKNGSLTAGDIVLQQKENYFLKYYKNVRGASLESNYLLAGKHKSSTSLGMAIAKGKFASINVPPLEGVQGPYRLNGPNNERFIVVIANSEKVFLDGKLLTRGFNYDYVIDYNLAEITFNPTVLITQFSRIRIDFEYTEINYSRNLIQVSHYQQFNKLEAFVNYYRESDNPRNPLAFQLSDEDKLALSFAGDGLGQISGADTAGFAADRILYKKIDTLTQSGLYREVFVYTAAPQDVLFNVVFSEVGQGKGDYIRVRSTLNGQIYAWVEPLNGLPQGNFAPVRIVPTPVKRQMLNAGLMYQMTSIDQLFGEIAFSNTDLNLYSGIDRGDDLGKAVKIGWRNTGKSFSWAKDYLLKTQLDYEHTSRFFKPIDRFRYIEFDRDWSTRIDTSRIADHIATAHLELFKNHLNRLAYTFTYRQRGGQVDGWQQKILAQQDFRRLSYKADVFLMRNQFFQGFSQWQRLFSEVVYKNKLSQLGYRYNFDKNKITAFASDSITGTAMHYDEHIVFLQSPDSTKFRFRAEHSYRVDNLPVEGKLQKSLEAQTSTVGFQSNWNQQSLNFTATYRKTIDFLRPGSQEGENILGRLDWNARFLDKHIRSDLTFATSNGRELRREFSYLSVPNGQGTHTWRDDNNDGLQDLNEFYLSINPDERNFIKVFLPTTDFITAISNIFSHRLQWEAPRNWKNAGGIKSFFNKFSNISSWTINKRFTDADFLKRINPFAASPEESILSTQENFRNTLFFNRSSPVFGLEFNFSDSRQKQLLVNGFESRENQETRLTTRKNLGKFFNLKINAIRNSVKNRSDFLLNRNYNIQTLGLQPELAFQPNQDLRLSVSYQISDKNNGFQPENGENALLQQWSLELRWNKLNKRNLLASLRYTDILFKGEVNSPVAYEMLEALLPGVNWIWNINLQQKLTNGLQLNLSYDGRKSATNPSIHIGRVQLTALF